MGSKVEANAQGRIGGGQMSKANVRLLCKSVNAEETINHLIDIFLDTEPLNRLMVRIKLAFLSCRISGEIANRKTVDQCLEMLVDDKEFIVYEDIYESGFLEDTCVAPIQFVDVLKITLEELEKRIKEKADEDSDDQKRDQDI